MRRWTRSDTQCICRRAVGEGAAAARKLGGGGHGGEKNREGERGERRRRKLYNAARKDEEATQEPFLRQRDAEGGHSRAWKLIEARRR